MRDILKLRSDFFEKLLDIKKEDLWYLDLSKGKYYRIEQEQLVPMCDLLVDEQTIVHPSEKEAFKKIIEEIHQTSDPFLNADFLMLPDVEREAIESNYRLYNLYFIPDYDDNDNLIGVMMKRSDVEHRRKRHEKADIQRISIYNRQMQLINQLMGVSRINYNPITHIFKKEDLNINDENDELLGVEDFFKRFIPKDEWINLSKILARMDSLEDFGKIDYTTNGSGLSNGDKIVRIIILPIINHRSEVGEYIIAVMDITEHEKLMIENKRVSELLNQLINNLPGLVFVKDVDDDFRYIVVNEAFADKYGKDIESVVGKNDFDLITPKDGKSRDGMPISLEDANRWHRKDLSALDNPQNEPVQFWEEFRDKNGKMRYLKTEKFHCKLLDRNLLIGSSIDVTELQMARMQAEGADKLKTSFLMNISHEIRTPLNAIVGFSDMIVSATDLANSETNMYVEQLRLNTRSLLSLLGGIMNLAKLESKSLSFTKQRIEVSGIINEAYTQNESNLQGNNNITLEMQIPQKPAIIYQDSQMISEVINNIIDNAFKFTTKGKVVIGYDLIPTGVRFCIKDTGIGIAPEDADRIFEKFEKVNSFIPGTGLGLCICKLIVEEMGGKIGVISTLGEGSEFWFQIPYGEE